MSVAISRDSSRVFPSSSRLDWFASLAHLQQHRSVVRLVQMELGMKLVSNLIQLRSNTAPSEARRIFNGTGGRRVSKTML